MSDNIFNYFSNKGTRKVDPIDDAEFESIDAPQAPAEPPKSVETPVAVPAQHSSDRSETARSRPAATSNPTAKPKAGSRPTESSPAPAPKKSQSHWDYLASFLGIKKEAATVEEHPLPAASESQIESPFETRPEPTGSVASSLFDQVDAPPKEEAILSNLFQPTGQPSNEDVEFEDDAQAEDDTDLDYVEFEVEDLDESDDSDDSDRKSRRSPQRASEDRGRSPREPSGRDSNSRDRRSRRDHESSRASAEGRSPSRERSGREDGRRSEPARDDSRRAESARDDGRRSEPARESRPARRENRESTPRNPVAEAPVEGAFGSGIFEPRSRDEGEMEGEAPRKKRRRRRRSRGGAKSESETASSGLPRMSPVPEVDPPDEFFDEIGWQPAASSDRTARSKSTDFEDDFEDDLEARGEDFGVEGADQEGDDRPAPRKRRRRRRGKGTADSGSSSEFSDRPVKSQVRKSEDLDDLDDEDDEVDYDRVHQNPRQARPGDDASRSKELDSRHAEDRSDKKRKFPTWEEAIAGMVESNIKNHSRSSGQGGRSGNKRGRRRR